ncbi:MULTISPECIES: LPS-assembly protein LptD [unclassified Lysobacter]|uniref:LPS-assembly protein LptD n=1 Tax=unclassified Lysobacter TaxID=2635362 RepID=UPI000701D70F|nr:MULTISPECIES: LPS-assembly protein LptD [unclassified Lysobacter]KRA14928.1 organic solvent tolerance protein [Lysobacter sp. Root604]KRD30177.1 organic solvent tolerance protein [Lysobacter sp. Root916]
MHKPLRLLPLSLCIALALPAQAASGDDEENWGLCPIQDVVPAFTDAPTPVGTAEQRTSTPTDIDGGVLERAGDDENIVVQDNVKLSRGDQFIGTDKLSYNENTGKYTADGNVRYQDNGMRMTAQRASGDQNADTHRIEDVQYQLTQRRGNGGAERIDLTGAKGKLVGSTYSTCPPNQRVWELRSRQIDLDTEDGFGVAHNATLRIGKVPVLYVPWFKFPIDERRQTGLLYPAISLSGKNGFDYKQPIYLNLAPNYDATLYPRIMAKRGGVLGGEFRWLYPDGKGEVYANFMPSDKLPGDRPSRYTDYADLALRPEELPDDNRGQFALKASHSLDGNWYASTNLAWVSDKYYLQDFSNSLYGVSAYSIRSDIGLYGRGRHWEAGVMADHYQLADYTLTERSLPYDRLPRAYFRWAQPFGRWFEAGVDSELVRFQHTDEIVRYAQADGKRVSRDVALPGGSRFDVKPYISLPLEGASWFIRPKLAFRYTAYELEAAKARELATTNARAYAQQQGIAYTPDMDARFYDKSPNRSLPITSVDAGLYFDRDTEIRGDRYLHTLEPRLFYLRAPYRNQDGLPIFDTDPMTFSWGQLFRENRYSGADRQTDANQLTVALTTRLISEDDGRERLSASIGQIQYFDDSRVTVPGESPIEQGKSAWVADVSVSPSDRWTINGTYQYNPKFSGQDLASLRARYLFGDAGIVNIGYRYRRNPVTRKDLLEQADLSFLYPINENWSVVGRYYYSLLDKKPLEQIAGLQWESCCLAVRVVARRYLRDRSGDLNSSLQVEFELKGLGSAGQNTERVLRRAILGYDRDDLYLVPPSSVTRGQTDPTPDPTL